jgi:hypothetical protein
MNVELLDSVYQEVNRRPRSVHISMCLQKKLQPSLEVSMLFDGFYRRHKRLPCRVDTVVQRLLVSQLIYKHVLFGWRYSSLHYRNASV